MPLLHHDSIHRLFEYILAALILPVTEDQYRSRVFLPAYVSEKVSGIVKLLTEAHALAKAQSEGYKNVIHPTIVQLAIDIQVHTEKATNGSDKDTIFEAIAALTKASTESEEAALIGPVKEQVQTLSSLLSRVQTAIDALAGFKEQVQAHNSTLQARNTDVQAMRDAEGAELRNVEGKLQESRNALAADIALHEEYRRNAALAAAVVIIPIVGPLSGGITAAVYLKKAADAAERIENTKRLIGDHQRAIESAQAVIACLHVIEANLQGVMALSSGAAYALEETIAFWQMVAEDLTNIKEMVNENIHKEGSGNAFMALLRAKLRSVGIVVAKYKEVAHIDGAQHDEVDMVLAQLGF
ncbi:hypothetical protein GGF50DRAFT_119217 [Schizophyllum commune]